MGPHSGHSGEKPAAPAEDWSQANLPARRLCVLDDIQKKSCALGVRDYRS